MPSTNLSTLKVSVEALQQLRDIVTIIVSRKMEVWKSYPSLLTCPVQGLAF